MIGISPTHLSSLCHHCWHTSHPYFAHVSSYVLDRFLETESSMTTKDMSKLVALYCEARGIAYASNDGLTGKQRPRVSGMHGACLVPYMHSSWLEPWIHPSCLSPAPNPRHLELLMPFVALDLPLGDCYNAYYAMLAKFALKQLDEHAYVVLFLSLPRAVVPTMVTSLCCMFLSFHSDSAYGMATIDPATMCFATCCCTMTQRSAQCSTLCG
jgi:hypothetical protein